MTFVKQSKFSCGSCALIITLSWLESLAELTTKEEKFLYFTDKKKREMLNVQFIGNLFLNKSLNL